MKRLAMVLAVVTAAASCWGQAPTAAGPGAGYRPQPPVHRGGTLVIGDWEAPTTLNPLAPQTETDLRLGALLFAPLWGFDSRLHAYPELVREVPSPENGRVRLSPDHSAMTVTIRLVTGLEWSDGQPITSDDVIFTWQALCDPALAGADRSGFERIAAMERLSDSELTWTFAGGADRCGAAGEIPGGIYSPYLLLGTRLRLLPRHRLAGLPRERWSGDAFFTQPDVSSGPFRMAEASAGHLLLDASPRFAQGRASASAYTGRGGAGIFNHAATLGRIVFKLYSGRDALLGGLRAGESDLALHLAIDDVPSLAGIGSSKTESESGLEDEFLNPNHAANTESARPLPWSGPDAYVLDALDLALDRVNLVQQVTAGLGRPSAGLYPSALGLSAPGLIAPARDLARARRLLDDHGWTLGPDGIRSRQGDRLEFTLLISCGSGPREREQELLRRQWAELGASVKPSCRKRSTFFGTFGDRGDNAAGAFDLSLYSNTWAPDPSAWTEWGLSKQVPSSSNPNGQNWNRCADPVLDRQLEAGAGALDSGKRRLSYLAAQREWLAHHCTIPLFEWPIIHQVSTRLHNFAGHPRSGLETWNSADWWV